MALVAACDKTPALPPPKPDNPVRGATCDTEDKVGRLRRMSSIAQSIEDQHSNACRARLWITPDQ